MKRNEGKKEAKGGSGPDGGLEDEAGKSEADNGQSSTASGQATQLSALVKKKQHGFKVLTRVKINILYTFRQNKAIQNVWSKKNHEPKESLCKNMPFTMFCCTYKWTARRQKFVQFMLMKCFELCFAHESVFWYLILISKCWYFDCLVDLAGGVEVFKRMT